jgi:hypothetical protein
MALWLSPKWAVRVAMSTGWDEPATYRKMAWRVGSPRARAWRWSERCSPRSRQRVVVLRCGCILAVLRVRPRMI